MDLDLKRGIIGVAIVAALVVALALTLAPKECSEFDCFQERMIRCAGATFVNEEPEASWGYEVLGTRGEQCEIEVTLLGAKEGDLDLRRFEGHSMRCFYEKGFIAYPEKDLGVCTGELKEDLQGVVIEKLYRHIFDNLGEIAEELRRI